MDIIYIKSDKGNKYPIVDSHPFYNTVIKCLDLDQNLPLTDSQLSYLLYHTPINVGEIISLLFFIFPLSIPYIEDELLEKLLILIKDFDLILTKEELINYFHGSTETIINLEDLANDIKKYFEYDYSFNSKFIKEKLEPSSYLATDFSNYYDFLLNYKNFTINLFKGMSSYAIHKLLKKDHIVKHIIDNHNMKQTEMGIFIQFACKNFSSAMIIYFIDKIEDLEYEYCGKNRFIHYLCNINSCIDRNNSISVKYLIEKGVELNCQNEELYTPIHYICRDYPNLLKMLFDRNVNFNLENKHGNVPLFLLDYPLFFAYSHDFSNHCEICKLLIDRTENLHKRYKGESINTLVCRNAPFDLVKIIFIRGQELEKIARCDDDTPLKIISRRFNINQVKELLSYYKG